MVTVIKELVQQGHDQAAELNASCGAVDVRIVAQLISDLATRLDCTTAALREMTKKRDAEHTDVLVWEKTMFKVCGEDGPKSVEDKFAELQAKCAALAAENAALKAAAKETLAHWAAAEPGGMEQMMDKCMPSLRVAYCETPATDTFLAEVQAQGVEMVIAYHRERADALHHVDRNNAIRHSMAALDASDVAAQLRQDAKTAELVAAGIITPVKE